jgi:hypothetical protein
MKLASNQQRQLEGREVCRSFCWGNRANTVSWSKRPMRRRRRRKAAEVHHSDWEMAWSGVEVDTAYSNCEE